MNHSETARDYSRNQAEYEDFWHQRWRRTWTYSIQSKLKHFRWLMRRYGFLNRPNFAVFDQGFGLGLMLFNFRRDTFIAGLELSQTAVNEAVVEAKRRGFDQVDLRQYVAGAAYPADWRGRFDLVISSHVLEHCEEPEPVLASLLGLLKPEGHACIMIPINEVPGDDLNHFHWFTPESMLAMARRQGLEPVETFECDRLFSMVIPLVTARQRHDSWKLKCVSIAFNALTAPLPKFLLDFLDGHVIPRRYRNRQFVAMLRKHTIVCELPHECG